jgi:DNA-binding XRE family transcriptional regulator
LPQNIGSSTAVPSATELKLRLVLLGFWPRAFEDFFLERRRAIVRALGPETKRQGRGRSMSRKRAKLVRGTTRSAGPIDKYFGDRLRARRIMMKMSQDDLGKSLGVSFQQIQKYEKGTNRLSAAMMGRVVETLDVDIGYFYDEIPKTKRSG